MDATPFVIAGGTVVGASVSGMAVFLAAKINRNVGSNGGSSVHQRLDHLQDLLVTHVTDDGRHWVE